MGRFDDLLQRMSDVGNPTVNPGDEDMPANNLRNWTTDKINAVIPDSYKIDPMSVADDKRSMQNLPEMMGSGSMGSIGLIGSGGRMLPHADVMNHPAMQEFLANAEKFKAENYAPSQYGNAKQALVDKIQKEAALSKLQKGE